MSDGRLSLPITVAPQSRYPSIFLDTFFSRVPIWFWVSAYICRIQDCFDVFARIDNTPTIAEGSLDFTKLSVGRVLVVGDVVLTGTQGSVKTLKVQDNERFEIQHQQDGVSTRAGD